MKAKEWFESSKYLYDLTEHDEGGYLGIDTDKVYKMLEEYHQYKLQSKTLIFEDWHDIHEDEINTELAENGADRELDFNPEEEFNKRYEIYLNSNSHKPDINHIY